MLPEHSGRHSSPSCQLECVCSTLEYETGELYREKGLIFSVPPSLPLSFPPSLPSSLPPSSPPPSLPPSSPPPSLPLLCAHHIDIVASYSTLEYETGELYREKGLIFSVLLSSLPSSLPPSPFHSPPSSLPPHLPPSLFCVLTTLIL